MTDSMCVTGLVATTPRHITTSEGLAITSFRLASSQRRYDRTQQTWVDGETNWYTVSAFRSLGSNAAASINKGD
jgi:single-strand DNA-binding protein